MLIIMQKAYGKFWNKKSRGVSWFVRSKWYIITCRCIWQFLLQAYRNVRAWPGSLFISPRIIIESLLKKDKIELELLTDTDMLLIVEKRITSEICHVIHQYVAANNKYMTNYNTDKEPLRLMYLDANNLYEWAIS